MDAGGMELDTPDNGTFVSAITFSTNITEMKSRMNRQNKETRNLLRLLLANERIEKLTPTRKTQGNSTSGAKWVDEPNGTGPPTPAGGAHSLAGET